MTFVNALTNTQLNHMRGVGITGTPRFYSEQYLSVSSNKSVFEARVNQSAFTASFASVDYDTVTVGAFGDIEVGMTVLLSSTNDKRDAYFVGRVRKAPDASTLFINETSVSITNNDYIFVLNDFRIAQRLLRFASNTLFVDFDEAYATPAPLISGLQSAYVGFVSGTPAGLTISFSASALAVASGATISTYLWTVPTGGTVTAGSVNTASVTIRFDASPDEYWLKLQVTDSNGVVATRYIPIWAHDDDNPPATGFTGASIRCDVDNGYSGSVGAFDGVSNTLDNTLVCVWSEDYYNDTEIAINTNVNLLGRLRREQTGADGDAQFSTLPRDTQFEIEGAGVQLARLTAPQFEITTNSSPSIVGQIASLTLWRAMAYLLQVGSTFNTLHSLEFDATTDAYRVLGLITQGESMVGAVNDIAQSINSAMAFSADGYSEVVRNQNYESTARRNALVTVADFGESDTIGIGLDVEQVDLIGRVEAVGASYNTVNGQTTPVLGLAPGVAQGEGEGTAQLTRQVLLANVPKSSAQVELNQRAGNKFADDNRRVTLNMTLPDGYYFLTPSRNRWVTWSLSSFTNNRGYVYDDTTRWTLTSINHTHNHENGTRDVSATFEIETVGAPGQSVEYPPPTATDTALPSIPAFNTYPQLPDIQFSLPSTNPADLPAYIDLGGATNTEILSDGNTVAVATTTQLWILTDVKISSTPPATEVTPSDISDDEVIKAFKWSGFGKSAYIATYDTVNDRSRVWYSDDAFTGVWTARDYLTGEIRQLITTGTEGEFYLNIATSGTGSGTWTQTFDFTQSNGNWIPQAGDIAPTRGTWSSAGWASVYDTAFAPNVRGVTLTRIDFDIDSSTITGLSVTFDYSKGFVDFGTATALSFACDATARIVRTYNQLGATETGLTISSGAFSQAGVTNLVLFLVSGLNPIGDTSDPGGSSLITEVTVSGTGDNPFVGTDSIFSDDFGATYGNTQTLSSAGSSVGLDTIKLRSEAIAGFNGDVGLSDSTGENYASYGTIPDAGVTASAIVIPRYEINTASTSNSNITPEYILGSTTLDSGTSQIALYSVTSSGATFTDITPNRAADYGTVVSANSITVPYIDGRKIAGIFDFAGTRALYVSTPSGIGFWDDVATVGANADYVRMRKNDIDALDLYYVDDVLVYSSDFGQTQNNKTTPNDDATDPLILVEVYDV